MIRPLPGRRRWTTPGGRRGKGVAHDGFPERTTGALAAPGPGGPAAGRQPGGEAVGGGDSGGVGRAADAGAGRAGDGRVAAAVLPTRGPGPGRTGAGVRASTQGPAPRAAECSGGVGEGERAVEARSGSAADAGAAGPAV